MDIVAHYIVDEVQTKREIRIIDGFHPDTLDYCPYRLDFQGAFGVGKPQRLELIVDVFCGSSLNGRPKWQGFYQRIR